MNSCLQKDLKNIASADFIPWSLLRGKTVLITGATGLIGYNVINALLYVNQEKKLGLKILAVVRDLDKAYDKFGDWKEEFGNILNFVVGSMERFPDIEEGVDYIIHGASVTASKHFIDQPVETISTELNGTENILQLAREKHISGMIYLSSMEVYGHPSKGHKVTEDEIGTFSPKDTRNSYPISKLQCEGLCHAYETEYNVPVMILRLTQTFGPGVNYNDNRIFAYFGRCITGKQDIVLKTKGETERSYLYTADAVTAILTVMLKGKPGQAYNVADESTYCSIADMAEKTAKEYNLSVYYDSKGYKTSGYLDTIYMDLDTSQIRKLGWDVLDGGHKNTINKMIYNMLLGWM